MNILLACLSILIAALAVALIALALTFIIGPVYRATLPRDYTERYEPSGQTHLNSDLP